MRPGWLQSSPGPGVSSSLSQDGDACLRGLFLGQSFGWNRDRAASRAACGHGQQCVSLDSGSCKQTALGLQAVSSSRWHCRVVDKLGVATAVSGCAWSPSGAKVRMVGVAVSILGRPALAGNELLVGSLSFPTSQRAPSFPTHSTFPRQRRLTLATPADRNTARNPRNRTSSRFRLPTHDCPCATAREHRARQRDDSQSAVLAPPATTASTWSPIRIFLFRATFPGIGASPAQSLLV